METGELMERVIDDLIDQLEDQGIELTELQYAAMKGHKMKFEQLYADYCDRKRMSDSAY